VRACCSAWPARRSAASSSARACRSAALACPRTSATCDQRPTLSAFRPERGPRARCALRLLRLAMQCVHTRPASRHPDRPGARQHPTRARKRRMGLPMHSRHRHHGPDTVSLRTYRRTLVLSTSSASNDRCTYSMQTQGWRCASSLQLASASAAACGVLSVSQAGSRAWRPSAEAKTAQTAEPRTLPHPGLSSLARSARGLLCGRVAAPLRGGAPAELLDERRQLAPHRDGLRLPRDHPLTRSRIACTVSGSICALLAYRLRTACTDAAHAGSMLAAVRCTSLLHGGPAEGGSVVDCMLALSRVPTMMRRSAARA